MSLATDTARRYSSEHVAVRRGHTGSTQGVCVSSREQYVTKQRGKTKTEKKAPASGEKSRIFPAGAGGSPGKRSLRAVLASREPRRILLTYIAQKNKLHGTTLPF